MSATAYLGAVATTLAVLASVACLAVVLRRRFAPEWTGASGRLLEAVLSIGLLTSLALALGTVGLFALVPMLAASAAVAGTAGALGLRRPQAHRGGGQTAGEAAPFAGDPVATAGRRRPPPLPGWSVPATIAVVAAVFAQWGIAVSWSVDAGIENFDSVWYHLPFAAEMAQSGETLPLRHLETVFLSWFYPQGSEVLHGLGMILTGRDALSLALNLGWLGLALTSAWCIGRPWAKGDLTVAAAAIVLTVHNLLAREPGTAKNDIVALALLLSAVAILVGIRRGRSERFPFMLAALATGLAAGVKVTALAPALGLTVAALIASEKGSRARHAAIWLTGLAVGGGYWYIRNLLAAGNPLPQLTELGPISLPGPESLQEGRPDFTVWHYLGDGEVWREYFLPGLSDGLGVLWPVLLALAVGGAVAALIAGLRDRERRLVGGLGFAALLGMAAYLITPLSAAGAEGEPTAFAINLRFALPSVIIGVVLVPLLVPLRRGWVRPAAFAFLVAVAAIGGELQDLLLDSGRLFGWALALGLVLIPAAAIHAARRHPGLARPSVVVVATAVYLVGAAGFGYAVQESYFDNRYEEFEPELGLSEPYRWASEATDSRIALAGTTAGLRRYGFYGPDLSNRVEYVGKEVGSGGFHPHPSCRSFRRGVNELEPDYLVTSPFLDFLDSGAPTPSPESGWAEGDEALTAIIRERGEDGGEVVVWRVDGELDPRRCEE